MKKLVALSMLLSMQAKADVIISAIYKKGTEETSFSSSNSTTTTTQHKKKKKGSTSQTITGSSSSTSSESDDAFGALIQVSPDSFPITGGVGIFEDQTVILTLGWRFK